VEGNFSYAHLPIEWQRRALWRANYNTNQAVLSTRGPAYSDQANDSDGEDNQFNDYPETGTWFLVEGREGTESDALRFAGSSRRWEGNVAFNDVHVSRANGPVPSNITYRRFGGSVENPGEPTPDNLFVDETDETMDESEIDQRRNMFLRMWAIGIDSTVDDPSENDMTEDMWWDGRSFGGSGPIGGL